MTASKKPIYSSIPFISHRTNSAIKKELRRITTMYYPQIDLKLVFSNNFSVKSFFCFKDKIPDDLQSNVVYSYNCGQCQATYVAETSRHLHTRISDYKGVSSRTGRPLSQPPNSRIRDHELETGHRVRSADFKILAKCQKYDLKITESIIIHRLGPTLNSHDASVPLHILR